ncbi:MAG: MFS transporter [PVC group bacterium]|nr:MFS transporter [PVC group bacterium]
MSVKHYATAPEDRIAILQKVAYGLGMLCNNLIPAALGCMAVVLNLGLGMNPALIGYIMSFPRLVDAFTDPVMGYVSDNTKSRFGRRRPYIFFGAILSGVIFALIWQLGAGHSEMFYFWFFLIGCILLFVGTTVFATPFIAFGYEMTPDYHERTRVMAWANWFGQIPWLLCPWFWWIMANKNFFETSVDGARAIALGVGATVVILGIMPAIFCKERYKNTAGTETKSVKGALDKIKEFGTGFVNTIKVPPFLKLCTATFFLFNGFMLVSGLGMYVLIYYLFGGDTVMGGKYSGLFGTTSALSTIFIVIPLVTRLSTKLGKRKAFIISTSISILGFLIKWWCFNPEYAHLIVFKGISLIPLLPAVLISFGIGGLFTTVGAMMADTCDLDELSSGSRREGVFGAIYWWTVKLGMSVAFALSGHVLNATGFNVELGTAQAAKTLLMLRVFDIIIPIITSIIAILAIVFYKITEERAHEIRAELEKRRGKN